MDEQEYGKHANKVMDAYEGWFEKPEQEILRIMGLFDRPAPIDAVEDLKNGTEIEGLTTEIKGLSDYRWKIALKNLRKARLLDKEDEHNLDELDCHPLVREHFGEKLKARNPKAWKEAHSRLYEWYKSIAKLSPDTIEEMAPLYSAVSHGCQAGRWREAYDKVYRQRIRRGNEYFSMRKLGAFGAELSVLSGFFEVSWSKPIGELREDSKASIMNAAGFCLRALGRLSESAQPIQAGLEIDKTRKDWESAARETDNLSELYLTIGDVTKALDYAEQSVKLADQSGDADRRMASRTKLADALKQIGRQKEAEDTFKTAEDMQKKTYPKDAYLMSLRGFNYCDLLLGQGKYEEVLNRASQTLEFEKEGYPLLDIALDRLSLGRAYMLKAQEDGDFPKAFEHLNQAVNGLRQAGDQTYIPRGLLARASLRRIQKEFDRAKHDVDEAFGIASRGGMGLYLADCHLEYARLYFDMGEEKAKEHLATAKEMIDHTGYHRRDKEIQELERKIED